MNFIQRYTSWLHTRWPAGTIEKLPLVGRDYSTTMPGVYVVGDLTGIPLLKFAVDAGAHVVEQLSENKIFSERTPDEGTLDLVIIGGGVGGMSAAVEAKRLGLQFRVIEATETFQTIRDFPAKKPIFTYPTAMKPRGLLQVEASVKEELLSELREQTRELSGDILRGRAQSLHRERNVLVVSLESGTSLSCHACIIALGRTGNFRKLNVPGEDLPFVFHRLHDPTDFSGQSVLVVGGGDSALESAIALTRGGATVTLSYRGSEFHRAKEENRAKVSLLLTGDLKEATVERPTSERVTTAAGSWMDEKSPGTLTVLLESTLRRIEEGRATLEVNGKEVLLPVQAVFSMIGREAPLEFFRRAKLPLRGESPPKSWLAFFAFLTFCIFLYLWKSGGFFQELFGNWPEETPSYLSSLGDWWRTQVSDRSSLLGTVAVSMKSPSFYYTLLYSTLVLGFGIRRIRRRATPYVRAQTMTLMLIQIFPLFLLPELLLPWFGYNGYFHHGTGRHIADSLFEMYIPEDAYLNNFWPEGGHPRAYWRAYGMILAWPLMVYNVFTYQPMPWWLLIAFVQTFIIIPYIVYRYGKGAYCGWLCSCGALAETLGDEHRHKMPHGPFWNRLNMAGQAILLIAFALLMLRVMSWVFSVPWMEDLFFLLFEGRNGEGETVNYLSYKWVVDIVLSGIVGVGFYFQYSGRVWCRFFCPLAALMHIYARFSRFRIFSDKPKCISCNVCTTVCHQGIDVMNFANKGVPLEDPQCVRCSACVHSCPTGVLSFGRILADGTPKLDRLPASLVQINERRTSSLSH